MAFTEPNPNDDFSDDNDDLEQVHQRAAVVATKLQDLEQVVGSDIGLYAERAANIQMIPGTNDWAVQMSFQIGDRAYRKLDEAKLDTDRVFEHLETDMIRDEIIRELKEGDED